MTYNDPPDNAAAGQRAHIALAAMPEPIVLTDHHGRIGYLNPAAQALLAGSGGNPSGRFLRTVMLLVDEQSGTAWDPLRECFKQHLRVDRDDLLLVSGHRSPGLPVSISAVPLNHSNESGCMLVLRDNSAVKAREQELTQVAQRDPLTQLPNRNLFLDRLGQAMNQAARDELRVAVLFLDLDNFKGVNDTHGHEAGDELLKTVARRLESCVRGGDSVGRYAGDEFTILLANLHQVEDVVRVVNEVQTALAAPIEINGARLPVNASIGISVYPVDGDREDNLLRAADGAMYHAKQQGKNCARFFNAEHNRLLPDQNMDEDQLRFAFEESQFQLYFQPRWNVAGGELVALEALLRWKHPTRGVLAAGEFMRIAEQNGFIRPLGNWALEQACREARRWRDQGLRECAININLSAYQFRHQDLPGLVADALDRFELPPTMLEMDVSEGTLRNHTQVVVPALHRIRSLGARVAISNFASGSSSWRMLKDLPAHSLHLGQSVVQGVDKERTDAATVVAALAFARQMRHPVVAEGVETEAQQRFLQQHGCNVMQGFRFGHPLPPTSIAGLLGSVQGAAVSA